MRVRRFMGKTSDIILERNNRSGLVTLNRPKALNALTYEMIEAMEEHYIEWAGEPDIYGVVLKSAGGRAFCSGGDLKAIYEARKSGQIDKILKLYHIEYQHNWTLDRFTKPHVSLMDGYVFGGGVGISLFGTHKVAGKNYRFAMPEAAIGFFPDVGATWFLPRLPGEIGMYLALTGDQIDRSDAYALGLLTHCIAAGEFTAIQDSMSDADPIDPVLDSRHEDPGTSKLLDMQPSIDRHFSQSSVGEILASLRDASGEDREWANQTLIKINRNSPLSLKVAFRQMRDFPGITLDKALALEARLARAFFLGEEVFEGIRALLIDKDKPKWPSGTLAEVSDDEVAEMFEKQEENEFAPVNPFAGN